MQEGKTKSNRKRTVSFGFDNYRTPSASLFFSLPLRQRSNSPHQPVGDRRLQSLRIIVRLRDHGGDGDVYLLFRFPVVVLAEADGDWASALRCCSGWLGPGAPYIIMPEGGYCG